MKVKINFNLYPTRGRYFIERDGSTHRGETWKDVIRKVKEYRRRNGFPEGDVAAEVNAQVCEREPQVCNTVTVTSGSKPKRVGLAETIRGRILDWVREMRRHKHVTGQPLARVSAAEAAARAEVCARCPRNKDISASCSTCAGTLAAFRKDLIGGDRALDDRLGGCEALGIDLKAAAHLNESRVVSPDLPANCWRKAI